MRECGAFGDVIGTLCNIKKVERGQIREDTTMSVGREGQEWRGSRCGLGFLEAEQTKHRECVTLSHGDGWAQRKTAK